MSGPGGRSIVPELRRDGPARPLWANPIERVARAERKAGEIDVVGLGHTDAGRPCVVVLGEAKARNKPAGTEVLDVLEAQRADVPDRFDTADTRLAVFSASGFTRQLKKAAKDRTDVALVDPEMLFSG